jgi:hypothetical protein
VAGAGNGITATPKRARRRIQPRSFLRITAPALDPTRWTEVDVDVHPIEPKKRKVEKRKSVKDLAAYGMWKDRTDFKDGVDYVNKIRRYRRELEPGPK